MVVGSGPGGGCAPVGATRCGASAPTVEVCTLSGAWAMQKTCPSTCAEGACTGACVQDDKQCGGDQTAQTCKDGQWVSDPAPCPNICSGKGLCTGDCKPGTKKCAAGPDSLTAFECDDKGQWQMAMVCPNLCSSGSCAGTCMPGKLQCASAGNGTEVCSAMGTWEPGQTCQKQTCLDNTCQGECEPNAKQCGSSNNPQKCTGGHWVDDGAACSNRTCVNGSCAGTCEPKQTRCGGTDKSQPQQCDATGNWANGGNAVCCGDGPGQRCCDGHVTSCQNNCGSGGSKTCSGGGYGRCSTADTCCGDPTCRNKCGDTARRSCNGTSFAACPLPNPECCPNDSTDCKNSCGIKGTRACVNGKFASRCSSESISCAGKKGQACRSGDSCDAGLYCCNLSENAIGACSAMNTCVSLNATGKPCNINAGGSDCQSGSCNGDEDVCF